MKSIKKQIFILSYFFLSYMNAESQDCNCRMNLEYLIKKVESNYAGFTDKVNKGTRRYYKNLCYKITQEAENVSGIECFGLLNKYISWFKDRHLSVSISARQKNTQQIQEFYEKSPRRYIDTTKVFNSISRTSDPLEGVWELKSSNAYYRVLIFRENNGSFTGVVLNADNLFWKPWQIKIKAQKKNKHKYSVTYFLQTHDFIVEDIEVCNHSEMYLFGNSWHKAYPQRTIATSKVLCNESRQIFFEELSSNTNRIVLPSFAISNAPIIDSIIKSNDSAIRSKKYLIIDIRNNSGGWTGVSNFLIPYFYTNPIKYEQTIYKSSDDIIGYYKEKNKDTTISKYYRELNVALINKLELNKGKLIGFDTLDVYKQDNILAYPKKIAVLINGNCMSAAEMFALTLKQSTKTIIFGENSRGVVDYGNVRSNQTMPCSFFQFSYPIVKRSGAIKTPIDNIGVKPDILLKGPEREWVNKIMQFLENN
jgi:Peptidase family S41